MISNRLFVALMLLAASLPALTMPVQPTETRVENVTPTLSADDNRPELATVLPQSRLVGKSRLTFWGFQVYDARLWVLPGFKADKLGVQPFALELSYLRSFDNLDIAARSITEMRRSAPISDAQAQAWIDNMVRVIPDVKAGDRVTGVHRPGVGVQFLVNGKPAGDILDAEFARLFFGIWLSPKTSQPAMRQALLAGVN
jgi:hypothetical protein